MAAESLKPSPHEAKTQRLRLDTVRELGSEVDLDVLRKAWWTKTSTLQDVQTKKTPASGGGGEVAILFSGGLSGPQD